MGTPLAPLREPRVMLLSMPWTAISEPSLGLAILKARLTQEGLTCRVRHLNLLLLKYLKASTYFGIGEAFALNDFVFTRVLQGDASPDQLAALDERLDDLLANDAQVWLGHQDREVLRELVLDVRDIAAPRFLEDCVVAVEAYAPSLVGFTCLFDQTIASVALAKLIKERCPSTLIVMGGYALEGPVGAQVMKSFPWVDAVARGDGEDTIGSLARASVDRSLLAGITGLIYRAESLAGAIEDHSLPIPRAEIERSPIPDYADYDADVQELEREHRVSVRWDTLPIETSRGCWWGQKAHCVFCGIDDETMKYRYKEPEGVLDMMSTLASRHGLRQLRFSDYILPHRYYRTLLPRLAEQGGPYVLSCEMKANIDLERFRLMRDAGFVEVQPGVESFSTSVLRKMRKGVSAIQNIYTLLLGYRFDVEVHYNFLYGFPTDEAEEYHDQLRTIPLLYHLVPPISRNKVVTTRFAPMQTQPGRFGVTRRVHHDRRYRIIFSQAFAAACGFDYDQYCYYFEQPYTTPPELEELYALLRHQIQYWKDSQRMREVRLSFALDDHGVSFLDSRYGDMPRQWRHGPDHALVYAALADEIVSAQSLADATGLRPRTVEQILAELVLDRVVFREGNQCVGLAVPASVYAQVSAREKAAKWVSPHV